MLFISQRRIHFRIKTLVILMCWTLWHQIWISSQELSWAACCALPMDWIHFSSIFTPLRAHSTRWLYTLYINDRGAFLEHIKIFSKSLFPFARRRLSWIILTAELFSQLEAENVESLPFSAPRVHGKYGKRKIRECSVVILVILERENKYSGSLWQFVIFGSFKRAKKLKARNISHRTRRPTNWGEILILIIFSTSRCCCSHANIRRKGFTFYCAVWDIPSK